MVAHLDHLCVDNKQRVGVQQCTTLLDDDDNEDNDDDDDNDDDESSPLPSCPLGLAISKLENVGLIPTPDKQCHPHHDDNEMNLLLCFFGYQSDEEAPCTFGIENDSASDLLEHTT